LHLDESQMSEWEKAWVFQSRRESELAPERLCPLGERIQEAEAD